MQMVRREIRPVTDVASWITGQDIGIVNPGLMGISGDYGNGNAPG